MARPAIYFVLWSIFYSSSLVADCLKSIPDDDGLLFAKALIKSDLSTTEKVLAIDSACNELDISHSSGIYVQTSKTIPDKLRMVFRDLRNSTYTVEGISAFTILGGTKAEKEFKNQILLIKNNPDPLIRIKSIFDLVSKYQGNFDDNALTTERILQTPKQIITNSAATGDGGVCRDFAHLLYWSLLQVARPNNAKPNLGNLDETMFSVDRANGCRKNKDGSLKGCHAWARINLPTRKNDGYVQFPQFDLDTTWYSGSYTPLHPRFKNLPRKKLIKLFWECRKIQKCLSNENNQYWQRVKDLASQRKKQFGISGAK